MGFVDNLKNIFSGKKEVSIQEEVKEVPLEVEGRKYQTDLCAICNEPIGTEKWTKAKEYFMHKRCFRKQKRNTMKQMKVTA